MDESKSDCDSVLSTDSLEVEVESFPKCKKLDDESQVLKNVNYLMEYNDTTVPFYKGEVLVDDVKRKSNAKKAHNKTLNLDSQRMVFDRGTLSCRASSFLYSVQRTNSARLMSTGQRFSRRMEIGLPNSYSVKSRGRSVSYLEQFKRKNYGVNKVESTTYSTVGSEQGDHSEDLSFSGSVVGSSTLSTSEFEFYEGLMANLNTKPSCVETADNTQTFDHKPLKLNKASKPSKEKLLLLTKLDSMQIINKKEIDRKKSLQKRDEYANQVKLRNQFNINKQKEKDKRNKFKNQNPIQCNLELEECYSKKTMQKQTSRGDAVPFSFHEMGDTEKGKKSTSKLKTKVSKTNKTDKKFTKSIKNKKITEDLSELQHRHEKEKMLVDSIRNLIIKT